MRIARMLRPTIRQRAAGHTDKAFFTDRPDEFAACHGYGFGYGHTGLQQAHHCIQRIGKVSQELFLPPPRFEFQEYLGQAQQSRQAE